MITLKELATSQQLTFQGNGDTTLSSVATLEKAQADQISFLANPAYRKYLNNTQAGAVILTAEMADQYDGNALISENPYVVFAHVAQKLNQQPAKAAEIHPTAAIEPTAQLGQDVSIGPLAVIAADTKVGDRCQLGAHVCIGEGVVMGQDCDIKTGAIIEAGCILGDRVIVHPGAVIGADGFGLARDHEGWVKIPQTGVVELGNDCEVGANTTIDRGAIENTVLGDDVRLDNQIQIGHNVRVGDHTIMAGCVAVAGSAVIGENCLIGGGAGIVGHISICDGTTIQAMSLVTHDIKKAGSYSAAAPLQPTKLWRKNAVRARQLDQIARRVNRMEKKLND